MPEAPELLAPAGDSAALKAALVAGADAVYLAGKHFGARAFAQNFDEAALRWARRVTTSLGRKLYITLNTLVFDHEFPLLTKTLDFYEALQPDALIIQDLGVATLLAQRKSKIPRHLSTQGNWEGFGGGDLLVELGITRVILPRETSLERLREICRQTSLEIEVFIHGAMCYSVSGRCFWSAALGERSGNRGTCAQPCRKPYKNLRTDSLYPFSPRDLRLVNRLPELVQTGVCSLKIEGRMKDAEYVYQVVSTYRRLLQAEIQPSEAHGRLSEVFSRPFHDGFFTGPPSATWATEETPGRQGIPVGTVTAAPRRDGLLEVESRHLLRPGDGLSWNAAEGRQGARITWIEKVPGSVHRYLLRGLPPLSPKTELILTDSSSDKAWIREWSKEWERAPIELFWSGHEGQPLAVETVYKTRPLRWETDETLALALKQGLTSGPLQEKFQGIGEWFRVRRHVFKALGKGLFVSPSALKKLKRDIAETLQGLETAQPEIVAEKPPPGPGLSRAFARSNEVVVRFWSDPGPLPTDLGADRLLYPLPLDPASDLFRNPQVSFWIPPPRVESDFSLLIEILSPLPPHHLLCLGWEGLALAQRLPQHSFRFDWTFNLANHLGLYALTERGFGTTACREWPTKALPRINTFWALGIHPLVSLSRFPSASPATTAWCNTHGDQFFLRSVAPELYGLFLKSSLPPPLPLERLPIQIDVAFPPDEDPATIFKQVSRLISQLK
jgi:collagenase-like PrtC family protease